MRKILYILLTLSLLFILFPTQTEAKTINDYKNDLKKLEEKFRSDNKYLSYVDYSVSFRKALDLQVNQLAKMMETGDLTLYKPVKIR